MHTVAQSVPPTHRPPNANRLPALEAITILDKALQPLDHAQATTATAQQRPVVCHTAPLIVTIHTVSKPSLFPNYVDVLLCSRYFCLLFFFYLAHPINIRRKKNSAAFSFNETWCICFCLSQNLETRHLFAYTHTQTDTLVTVD